MKPLNIDRTNTYAGGVEQIPTDRPHICVIQGAEEINYTSASGYNVHRLDVYVEVVEGEYKDYYAKKFEADKANNENAKWKGVVKINIPKEDGSEQDDWTIKSFNSNILAIEASNPGYTFDWDEDKLDGKKVGLVLRKKEWCFNGRNGFYSEPFKFISLDDIKAGKFREPKAKLLPEGTISTSSDAINNFVSVDENSPEEVPF